MYHKSQFKKFSDLDITKQLAKQNTSFNFVVYFIQVETHKEQAKNKWLKIQLWFNTWTFSLRLLLYCTNKTRPKRVAEQKRKKQLIFTSVTLTIVWILSLNVWHVCYVFMLCSTIFILHFSRILVSVVELGENWEQGGLHKKEIKLNLCHIFSILIFNELYLLA